MIVRFFAYDTSIESFRLVTLTPDAPTVSTSSGGKTDEGWSTAREEWTLAGDRVTREWGTDGVDCDGRSSTFGSDSCPLDRLAVLVPFGFERADAPFLLPDWRDETTSQRDHSAEQAGY